MPTIPDTLSSSAMPGGGADVDIIDGDLVFQRSWMCLRPTVAYDTFSGDGDNISYALVAEIPSAPTPVEALSGTDGSTTYSVSAPPPTP